MELYYRNSCPKCSGTVRVHWGEEATCISCGWDHVRSPYQVLSPGDLLSKRGVTFKWSGDTKFGAIKREYGKIERS